MNDIDKKKILNIVRSIAGKSYHQGTFASISRSYPSNYIKMSNDILEEYKKLEQLLQIGNGLS